MPRLVVPHARHRSSFLEAMAEFEREGARDSQTAGWIAEHGETWHSTAGFDAFVEGLRALETDPAALPTGWVPTSVRWWVDGDAYLGRIALRHRLNHFLRELGGHIGYDVRPSARRRGHATAMLAAILPEARERGIDPALVTCDEDNLASRRTIEANGGVLEDVRGVKRRYWVPTGSG